MLQEWYANTMHTVVPLSELCLSRGACYYNTSNNLCPSGGVLDTNTRNTNIKDFAGNITAAGIPWLYWQVLPNADPHVGSSTQQNPCTCLIV